MKSICMIPSRISGTFVVPDSVEYVCGFTENSRITHFIIGKNVCGFSCGHLSCHKYLKKLTVAKGNKSFAMKKGVLYSKDMTEIYGSLNLKGIYRMPSTVKSVYPYAFASNRGLKKVILSDKLDFLSTGIFAGCRKLAHIKFGKKDCGIGEGAFYKTAIKKIKLPKQIAIVYLRGQSFRTIITSNPRLKVGDFDYEDEFEQMYRITNPLAKKLAKEFKIKIVQKK